MIGEYLKESREKAKKSVYDVEREIKINHGSIYRWERNENIPSIEQCILLADYYGVSLDELVGREFGHSNEHAKALQINYGGNNTQNNRF